MGDTFFLACGPYCFTTAVTTLGWYHLRFEIRCEGKMIFKNVKGIILKKIYSVICSVNQNVFFSILRWAKCGLD
jgi:hypothetical protein